LGFTTPLRFSLDGPVLVANPVVAAGGLVAAVAGAGPADAPIATARQTAIATVASAQVWMLLRIVASCE
jgi:hypothetical protein